MLRRKKGMLKLKGLLYLTIALPLIISFSAIAVVTKDGGFSCGACRQVLNEFSPNILLIVAKDNSEIVKEIQLNEILPYAFGPATIGK